MSDKKDGKITPFTGGFMYNLTLRIKLIIRLLRDPRVNPLLKVLPIASLIYLVVPDLVPTPIDDAAIIWLGSYLFVELCPPEVVEEHMQELARIVPGEWRDVNQGDEEVIEAEFWEEK
jgi:hypothetical protein